MTCFVAPRLEECRNCAHIRCNLCTAVGYPPSNRVPRKADTDLAAIGSHLHPPAYSARDGWLYTHAGDSIRDPLAQLQSERRVFNMVIAQSEALGNNPGERFIQDQPSTFDRIHSPRSSSRHRCTPSPSTSITSEVDYQLEQQLSDTTPPTGTVTASTSSSSLQNPHQTTQKSIEPYPARTSPRSSRRLSHHQSRQKISGRSKQTVHVKREQRAMNDHHTTTLDSGDLTSRLARIKKSHSAPNDGDIVSRLPRLSDSGRTSSTTSDASMSRRPPVFRKTQTSSTNSSTDDEVTKLHVLHSRTYPISATSTQSAHVEQGEFSKPRPKRRRQSNESSKSQKEFQYYGRHANSWLFNNVSVTSSVKKGFSKVFHTGNGRSEEEE